jgi:hypothetical protein
MKNIIIFFSIVILITTAACGMTSNIGYQTVRGSGNITTENRQVSGFERVKVCCGMELFLTQGETESLEIEADDNLIDEIITRVVDGTLDVKYQRDNNVSYRPTQAVRIYLSAVEMQAVSISGGGYLECSAINSQLFDLDMSGGSDAMIAGLTSDDIKINISGGGEMIAGPMNGDHAMMNFSGGSDAEILALAVEELSVDASGGGTIKVSGSVTEQDISLSGGSTFKAGDLKSLHTSFSASGGGDSTIWATETLSVQLMGDSDLAYYGQPQIFNPSFSGDSELDPLGERE